MAHWLLKTEPEEFSWDVMVCPTCDVVSVLTTGDAGLIAVASFAQSGLGTNLRRFAAAQGRRKNRRDAGIGRVARHARPVDIVVAQHRRRAAGNPRPIGSVEFLRHLTGGVGVAGIERRLTSDGRSSYRDVELRVHYTRGSLEILDAPGLVAAACSCYTSDKATYAGVLG